MSYLLRVIVCIAMSVMCLVAYGQDPYYKVIDKTAGLPSNAIYDLFQDSRGFMWIANDNGLTRYDGYQFITYTSDKQTFRAGNEIKEDKYGRIWYKNFDGFLYYIEHDTLRALVQNAPSANAGYAIINDHLLVKRTDGVDILDLASLKIVKSVPLNNMVSVGELQAGDKYHCIQDSSIVTFMEDGSSKILGVKMTGLPGPSDTGILVISVLRNLPVCFQVMGERIIKRELSKDIKYIQRLVYCGETHWCLTPNGMWGYDRQWRPLNNNRPYFATRNISCLMMDREGNYWMGTLDEGIILVPNMNNRFYVQPDLVPSVFTRSQQRLFVGTRTNSMFEYDTRRDTFDLRFREEIKHDVMSIARDSISGNFFIASLHMLSVDKDMHVNAREILAVKDMVQLDDKYFAYASSGISGLIATGNGHGTSVWDSMYLASPVPFRKNMSQFKSGRNRGRTLAFDPGDNSLYIGSSSGLQRITPSHLYEILDKGRPVYVRKLVVYRGALYLFSQQNELLRYNKATGAMERLDVLQEREQLVGIRRTGGIFFLLTSAGIRYQDTTNGTFPLANIMLGVRSEEVNDIELMNDKLFVATEQGVMVTQWHNARQETPVPGFFINSVSVKGKNVSIFPKLEPLSWSQNDIDIAYSILAFSPAHRYTLQYNINGERWQSAENTTRTLRLVSLAPGSYEIALRLVDEHMTTYAQNPVRFTIRKPFWSRWWFLSGCMLLLATGGYAYYRWQASILRRQTALSIEKMELEKNLRNSMLTAIRAQMNPHFFYNALNTIQSFIFSDDKRNASTYLVKMSRLTRLILEMSEKETITLDEEIESLKLYLELEQIRFGSDFNYEVTIASAVDTEMIRIPPMIVQPYVENAIKHGLLHKGGAKHLSIDFSRTNGTLCVTIDDNGVGRERAAEIKQPVSAKHQPFATNANSKRIELLNKERNKSIGIVYVDKKDTEGIPQGTTVIISIPLI